MTPGLLLFRRGEKIPNPIIKISTGVVRVADIHHGKHRGTFQTGVQQVAIKQVTCRTPVHIFNLSGALVRALRELCGKQMFFATCMSPING